MEDEIYIKGNEIQKKGPESNVLNSSVKIIIDSNNFGSGFFIKIKKNNGKQFYCLMTNQHVITPEIIEQNKEIKILYANEKKNLIIKLDQEDRFIKYYKDSLQIDLTVIQIIDKDNIENGIFLEPNYDYKNGYQQFNNKTISVVQYPYGEELSISNGKIKKNNKIIMIHTASTLFGSSGSPIVLKGTDKVLGIHFGGNEYKQENYGNFIGLAIDDIKKFERNGFGKEFYKNGDIKYIGNFLNGQYNDDNGLFYYEEGYEDGIYYYEKGDFFNGLFIEGKKIEGKIYDKANNIKFEGSFQNDIPIIDISDCNNNDKSDNNYEDNKEEDSKDYDKKDKINDSEEYVDDKENKGKNFKNANINSGNKNYNNNNSDNNNSNQDENNIGKKKGKFINIVKKFIYNTVDPIKDQIPFFVPCNACKHDIKKHTKIGDAIWSCSECSEDSLCAVEE